MEITEVRAGCGAMARQILTYLSEHPDAKDTVEGILCWWLRQNTGDELKQKVQSVLNHLVKERWLVRRRITGSEELYGANPERLAEIPECLAAQTNFQPAAKGRHS